ncbi:MAG: Glyoxalase-like domain [Chlorobi bacterium]|nr:Glyoxalase-like domain [Chlorobiota bacterium]
MEANAQHEDEPTGNDDEPMTPHLGNIAFWVNDFENMRKFYSEVIGVPERASSGGHVYYVQDGFSFSIIRMGFDPPRRGWSRCPHDPSLGVTWDPYITFYVPDLAAAIQRCRQAGIAMKSDEPFSLGEGYGMSIDVMDPDGNPVALTEL